MSTDAHIAIALEVLHPSAVRMCCMEAANKHLDLKTACFSDLDSKSVEEAGQCYSPVVPDIGVEQVALTHSIDVRSSSELHASLQGSGNTVYVARLERASTFAF